jgi:hypothetical protein
MMVSVLKLVRCQRSLAATLCSFTFYVAHPVPSIQRFRFSVCSFVMVTFTRMPYAEAARRARHQDRIVYAGLIAIAILILGLFITAFR